MAGGPVRVATVDGRSIQGIWEGFEKGQLRISSEGKVLSLSKADLMSIHLIASMSAPAAASQPADGVTVHLADGSAFGASLVAGKGDSLKLRTDLIGDVTLKLSSVAGIRFSRQEHPAAKEAFAKALEHRDPTQDTWFLMQEDKVSPLRGLVETLDAHGGLFKWRERTLNIDRSRAFGVVLARGAGVAARPDAEFIMADGSVWAGSLENGDERSIKVQLAAGSAIDVPLSRVTDIRFRNARVVFLSDLEPNKYEFTPWGTTQWPYRKDRSVADREMSIEHQTYERGIGMHSQSVLTYTLSEPFQQFASTIGLDDAVGARGNVVFRVLADGREVFNSGPVLGGEAARPVLVALNGAKTLQLCVDFGDELDVADQADWGAARLIK